MYVWYLDSLCLGEIDENETLQEFLIKEFNQVAKLVERGDCESYPIWSEWYENQDEYSVEDVFRKAVLKHGRIEKVYTDNGSVYISHQLKLSCSMLGIKLIRAKICSGKSIMCSELLC